MTVPSNIGSLFGAIVRKASMRSCGQFCRISFVIWPYKLRNTVNSQGFWSLA